MKVFGTGYQRTGTTSLARALRVLGIVTRDCPKELWYDLDDDCIRKHDGFTDNPIPLFYQELDRRHPGAKFVHTERDDGAWLKSVEWLFTVGRAKFNWDGNEHFHEFHEALYGTRDFAPDVFVERYRAHNRAVREYFASRPDDLLIMDISKGDGFDVLCPFLGLPLPAEPFPHGNRAEPAWRVKLRKLAQRLRLR